MCVRVCVCVCVCVCVFVRARAIVGDAYYTIIWASTSTHSFEFLLPSPSVSFSMDNLADELDDLGEV